MVMEGNTTPELPHPSAAVLLKHLEAVKDITLEENMVQSRLCEVVESELL